jgi:hypothetical protein
MSWSSMHDTPELNDVRPSEPNLDEVSLGN